jgi:hypothetical protein
LSRSPPRQGTQSDHAPSPTPSRSRSPTPGPTNNSEQINGQGNPSKLGFYPPSWQAFLQAAKLEMRLQAILTHPIPENRDALEIAREVLDTMLWQYRSNKIKMEKGKSARTRQVAASLCPLSRLFPTV